jgi:hypothetical protein
MHLCLTIQILSIAPPSGLHTNTPWTACLEVLDNDLNQARLDAGSFTNEALLREWIAYQVIGCRHNPLNGQCPRTGHSGLSASIKPRELAEALAWAGANMQVLSAKWEELNP